MYADDILEEIGGKAPNADLAGWTISSGFCAQVGASKRPQAMTLGKNADQFKGLLDQARYPCRNQEQPRPNQQEIRRIVPGINRLIRNLAHGGNEPVGLEDAAVGVVAGQVGLEDAKAAKDTERRFGQALGEERFIVRIRQIDNRSGNNPWHARRAGASRCVSAPAPAIRRHWKCSPSRRSTDGHASAGARVPAEWSGKPTRSRPRPRAGRRSGFPRSAR